MIPLPSRREFIAGMAAGTTAAGLTAYSYSSSARAEENRTLSQIPAKMSSWQRELANDLHYTRISMPGTHDSGTYKFNGDGPLAYAKTQTWNIEDQLKHGVRFFDLRLGWVIGLNSIQLFHGITPCGVSLQEVFNVMNRFLGANPSEFLFLRLTSEKGASIGTNMREKWNSGFEHKWARLVTENRRQSVGQLRGKALVFTASPEDYDGLAYDDLKRHDNYDHPNVDGKYKSIISGLTEALAPGRNSWDMHITYTSANSAAVGGATNWEWAWTVRDAHIPAEGMNRCFRTFIDDHRGRGKVAEHSTGIVAMDYPAE